jgi:hypothetical protein
VRGSPILVKDFSGGVNLYDAPFHVGANEARDARNVLMTKRGSLSKRNGSQSFGAGLGAGAISLYAAVNPRYLIASGGTGLWSLSPAQVITNIASGLSNNLRWQWITAPVSGGQGPLYGTNGVEMRYTNGTLAGSGTWTAAAGTLPAGKYVSYVQNRALMSGMTAYTTADPGSTLVASNVGNVRDWGIAANAAWAVELEPGDGDALTGHAGSGLSVVAFKNYKTFLITDLNTGANRRISDKLGAVAPRSIVETPYGVFFLSGGAGVCRTNGQTIDRMSDKILPIFAQIPPTMGKEAVGAYLNDRYYLAISTSNTTTNDTLLDLDLKTGAWWIHTLAAHDLAAWDSGSGTALSLFGTRFSIGVVQQLFVPGFWQDDVPITGLPGTSFNAYHLGPWTTFEQPYRRKRVRELHFDGTGRVTFSVAKDFATSVTQQLDQLFSTPAVSMEEAKAVNLGVARAWSVQFGNFTPDPLELDSYTFLIQNRKD